MLGLISRKYESGNLGPAAISNNPHDPGGKSYGIYQFSKELLIKYTKEGYFKFSAEPFTSTFDDEWKLAAKEFLTEFMLDQHVFAVSNVYIHVSLYANMLGYDTTNRKIQEAIFSFAIQHRRAFTLLKEAYDGSLTISDQLSKLYEVRLNYVKTLSLSPSLLLSLEKRYHAELHDVLNLEESSL